MSMPQSSDEIGYRGNKPFDKYVNHDEFGAAVTSEDIDTIVQLTQAEYDALGTKDPRTLYVIVG